MSDTPHIPHTTYSRYSDQPVIRCGRCVCGHHALVFWARAGNGDAWYKCQYCGRVAEGEYPGQVRERLRKAKRRAAA